MHQIDRTLLRHQAPRLSMALARLGLSSPVLADRCGVEKTTVLDRAFDGMVICSTCHNTHHTSRGTRRIRNVAAGCRQTKIEDATLPCSCAPDHSPAHKTSTAADLQPFLFSKVSLNSIDSLACLHNPHRAALQDRQPSLQPPLTTTRDDGEEEVSLVAPPSTPFWPTSLNVHQAPGP